MPINDPRSLARYPFLSLTREHIRDNAPPLKEILTSPAYADARYKGFDRVWNALVEGSVPLPVLLDEADIETEILSYPLARILVSVKDDKFLTGRYANAEAKAAFNNLNDEAVAFRIEMGKDLGMKEVYERDGLPRDVAERLKGTGLLAGKDVVLHFLEYLPASVAFNSLDWKLVNRDLCKGYVSLRTRKFTRLIEEMVRQRVLENLPLPVNEFLAENMGEMVGEIEERLREIKDKYRKEEMGEYSEKRIPPCVANIITRLKGSENLSHEARFFLAAFLVHIGFDMERMMSVFSHAPDFDPEIARYQLDQIRGKVSGTKYTPSSCKTLKTQGICYRPDSLCNRGWMTHPLTYYRVKGKWLKKKEEVEEEKAHKEGEGEEVKGEEKKGIRRGPRSGDNRQSGNS